MSAALLAGGFVLSGAVTAQALRVPPVTTVAPAPLRARDLPGEAGMPTAAVSPPLLTLSAPNAATTIASPVRFTETSTLLVTRGGHLSRRVDPLAAHPDSITPVSSTAFQAYSIEIRTDAAVLEIGFRAVGGHYRVWVDGHPTSLTPTTAPRQGAFYRLKVTFRSRATRDVRFESDESRFTGFTVSRTDHVVAARRAGKRAVILGDSFAEGTRANARFLAFGQTLCHLSGWDDCWVAGSGGTGYLANGAHYPHRVNYRGRVVNDVTRWKPEVVVVTGGRNDWGFPPSQERAESLALFRQIRAALPKALFITTSTFPSRRSEATSARLLAVSDAIRASSSGLADHYLDVMGSNAYITGGGNAGAPTGDGNADVLTSADKVHPTQAGHDELGRQLFRRLRSQLPR